MEGVDGVLWLTRESTVLLSHRVMIDIPLSRDEFAIQNETEPMTVPRKVPTACFEALR